MGPVKVIGGTTIEASIWICACVIVGAILLAEILSWVKWP